MKIKTVIGRPTMK